MISKLKFFVARAVFGLVIVAALGFGILMASVAAVLGLLLMVALRIVASAVPDQQPVEATVTEGADTAANPAQPA